MRLLVEKAIESIKGERYALDGGIEAGDLLSILFRRGLQIARGWIKSSRFKRRSLPVFVGKHVSICYPRLIKAGKGLVIGDNVSIDALSRGGIILGDNVSIGDSSTIECTGVIRNLGERLVIGSRVGFARGALISVRGVVEIGDDCIFGPNVSIHSENHVFDELDTPIRLQGEQRKGVVIEPDCWVGSGATILDGVHIGAHSVIGAGAVVTKDIPPYSVAVGVPAQVIKRRES